MYCLSVVSRFASSCSKRKHKTERDWWFFVALAIQILDFSMLKATGLAKETYERLKEKSYDGGESVLASLLLAENRAWWGVGDSGV